MSSIENTKHIEKVELRNLELNDYKELEQSMIESYKDMADLIWKEHHIESLIDKFPEGQIVVVADGRVVGAALSIIVKSENFEEGHTYAEITDQYTFNTHNSRGDVLYGVDVFIKPEYRGLRLGRRLYDSRKELCESLNLKSIVFGGRIPSYTGYSDELTPREYIARVRTRELFDPVLTFQLSNDFHVRRVLKGYMPGDKGSEEFAVLLEWNNIYYEKTSRLINAKKTVVRLGLIQWQMRSFNDIGSMFEQIEFFVDAVSGYQSDFVLFPELFNAPLMAEFNHLPESDAIRKLAIHTDAIRDQFQEYAISYNINIITGSMPLMENNKLYNVGFLCRRDGTTETYRKVHITPNELSYWGMVGGDKIQTFDTDCGKIGVLICYDVEFPELSRLMADDGLQILFVPFLTDTQNGFTRVQNCARARAIENECYVAIAGCVGNLPKVNNMDIQFAQSAVFTPADFPFPTNGIKAEATPNTEMTLIADVDLDLLKELHNFGSVRILKDRRTDLYELRRKTREE